MTIKEHDVVSLKGTVVHVYPDSHYCEVEIHGGGVVTARVDHLNVLFIDDSVEQAT